MITDPGKPVTLPTGFIETVAANVRAECALRGLLQKDIAKALGLAPSRISSRWKGVTPWQLDDLERLGELFGIPPQRFTLAQDCHAGMVTA